MYRSSREFKVVSLDGSRSVEDQVQQDGRATALSALDHYIARPNNPNFEPITIVEYVRNYTMPKELGAQPNQRSNKVVVITRPWKDTYTEAYAEFLQSEDVPPSLEDDIFRLQQHQQPTADDEVR